MRAIIKIFSVAIISTFLTFGISKAAPLCSGLVNGTYSWDQPGAWCSDQSACSGDPGQARMTDDDWNTYGYFGGYGSRYPGHFMISYAKPSGAANDSMWEFKDGNGDMNHSIPLECWDANPDIIMFRTSTMLQLYGTDWISGECSDGVGWVVIWNDTSASNISDIPSAPKQYEQTMWWDMGKDCQSEAGLPVGNSTNETSGNSTENTSTTVMPENTTNETSGITNQSGPSTTTAPPVIQQGTAGGGGGGGCIAEGLHCYYSHQCCHNLECLNSTCTNTTENIPAGASNLTAPIGKSETTSSQPAAASTPTPENPTASETNASNSQNQKGGTTGFFALTNRAATGGIFFMVLLAALTAIYFFNRTAAKKPTPPPASNNVD